MIDRALHRVLGTAWKDAHEVLAGLRALESEMRLRKDHRAVFATAYVRMTEALALRLYSKEFERPGWVEALTVAFAEYYRAAFWAFECGQHDLVPQVWRLVFTAPKPNLVIQDLLLGMNAHIVHDLPLAIADVSEDEDMHVCRRDFVRVLDSVSAVIDPIKQDVGAVYAPGLGFLSGAFLRVDEWWTYFMVRHFRNRSWKRAMSQVRAPETRPLMRAELDEESTQYGRFLLSLKASPRLFAALRVVEAFDPHEATIFPWIEPGTLSTMRDRHLRRARPGVAGRRIDMSPEDVGPRMTQLAYIRSPIERAHALNHDALGVMGAPCRPGH